MRKVKPLNLKSINDRINKEVCEETIRKLEDLSLIEEYKECKSVKKKMSKLESVLEKHKISSEKREPILDDYLLELIPPGTKGVMKGNKFNKIVKDTITNIRLDDEKYEVCFEKFCQSSITNEKPDWYILEKSTDKVLIGMNQLDLWNGGHQLNRGFNCWNIKY